METPKKRAKIMTIVEFSILVEISDGLKKIMVWKHVPKVVKRQISFQYHGSQKKKGHVCSQKPLWCPWEGFLHAHLYILHCFTFCHFSNDLFALSEHCGIRDAAQDKKTESQWFYSDGFFQIWTSNSLMNFELLAWKNLLFPVRLIQFLTQPPDAGP